MNISEYAKRLSQVVDAVKKRTGKDKVILVSHSMGGLVARTYLSYYGGESSVDKLIMVGTPNNGISGAISFLCGNTIAQFGIGLLDSIKNGKVSDFVMSPRKNTPECSDMKIGSDFLKKLNQNIPKSVKYLAVVGVGDNSTNCPNNEQWDGTVCSSSVKLSGMQTYEYLPKIHSELLHTSMINPNVSPQVYMRIVNFIKAG
jgi:uncharacterized alpha/beta hydrolase family protein